MSTKISQLTSAVDVTANDLIQIVDVEDGVMAPSGTNKKATASLLAKELAKQPLEPGVVISGSSSSDAVRITQTGAGNALVVEDSTNPDGTAFVVTNDGNVRIGTSTSSARKVDVVGETLTLSSSSTYALGVANVGGGNADVTIGSDSSYGYVQSWGKPLYLNSQGNNVVFGSGNVGIGTSAPTAKLDVNGRIKGIEELSVNYPPGTSKYLALQTNGVIRWGVGSGSETETGANVGSQFFINRHTDDGTYIDTAISIKRNNGNVGIGTQNPSYQFELSTDSAAKPSTSTWTISSDERLKENIEAADLDICYNAVKNIPLKRYKWKDEIYSAEQVADRSKIGWIAQDVQAVFPKAVNEHKFVYNQVKDEDGNVVSEDSIDDCLSLNSDQIYAALFGAVQKLMGEVESLQERIAELEAAP